MNRLKTVGVEIKQTDLQIKPANQISQIEDKVEVAKNLYDILVNSCVLYFGIHPSQIQNIVISQAIKIILKNHADLSLVEIEYSFERINISREVTIVVDDLIKPILEYKKVKFFVSREQQRLNKEIAEQNEVVYQKARFLKECKEIYNQSLVERKWIGTIWHCEAIARDYLAPQLDSKVKKQFWLEAKSEFRELKKNDEFDIWMKNMGKTEIRLFSEKIVLEAIRLGLNLSNEK